MPFFRKKPVVIEAVRVSEVIDGICLFWSRSPDWVKQAYLREEIRLGDNCIFINTREGVMRANEWAWLIRGVEGELYSCEGGIFEKTYEPVE